MDDDQGLEISVGDILKAFELAGSHFSNKGNARDKLESRKQVALDLIDWAVEECDRGKRLLEAESELAILRSKKDSGGSYMIGPFPLG